jgi:transcriptional regulator with XRE-family HTH domain
LIDIFNEELICKKIRNLRLNKNMTLDDLAKSIDLSKSYISKLERSKKSPPISTLYKIATALGTDLNFLITGYDLYKNTKVSVVKNNDQFKVSGNNENSDYNYYALAYKKNNKLMEPFLIEVSKNSSLKHYSHNGEEFNYLLKGKVEFIVDNDIFILDEGDSIYFESKMPHGIRNLSSEKSVLISVNTIDKELLKTPRACLFLLYLQSMHRFFFDCRALELFWQYVVLRHLFTLPG